MNNVTGGDDDNMLQEFERDLEYEDDFVVTTKN